MCRSLLGAGHSLRRRGRGGIDGTSRTECIETASVRPTRESPDDRDRARRTRRLRPDLVLIDPSIDELPPPELRELAALD